MLSPRSSGAVQWAVTFSALAGIVLTYHRWLPVNATTVALTLLLYILVLAAYLRLRYAVAASIAATLCYNLYFLPPVGTLTIADPQNWLALFVFLATGVLGSRLAQKARYEAEQARTRQAETEVLLRLSRELLQTDKVAELIEALPGLVRQGLGAESVTLSLIDHSRLYQAGAPPLPAANVCEIALRAGMRPRGLLSVAGHRLSPETLEAVGGLVSVALDRAQALEDLGRSEAAKKSERLRTLILDSITHELRTPLTSIKGAASALLASGDYNEEDRCELLTIIDEEADRLNRLVGQAVEMAQIDAHEVHMHFAPVSLPPLVEQARESCASLPGAHLIAAHLPTLPPVLADAAMIGKVLRNLLENAAKYSPARSPITLSARLEDGFVRVSVADHGFGIEWGEQALIFDRFYRSPARSGTVPGTGMGLAICRAIIEAHRGSLAVESRPGEGSVFTFSLPVCQDPRLQPRERETILTLNEGAS